MDLQERPGPPSPSSGAFSFDSDTFDAAEAARVSASALDRLDENLRCKSQMAATCVKQEVVDPSTGKVTKVVTGFTFCNHRYNDLEIAALAREAWRDFHGTEDSTFDWPEYKDINFVEGPAAIGLQGPSQNTDDDMELSFEGCDADFKSMKKITQYNVRQECINGENVTSNMDVSVEVGEIRENDRSDEKHQAPLKLSQDDLHLDILGKEKVETLQNSDPVSCISTNLDLQKQNSKVCITKSSVYFCSNPYNTMNLYPTNQNTEGNITGRVKNFDSIQYNLIDLDLENKNPDVTDSGRNFYPDSNNFVDLCPQNKTANGEGPGNRCACCYKLPEFNGKTSSLEYTKIEEDCVSIPSVINGEENTVEDRIVNAFSRKFCMNQGVNDNGHDNNEHVEDTASPLKQVDEFYKCQRPDDYSQASHSYSNEKVQNDRLVPRILKDVPFVKYESEANKAGGTKTPESEDQDVICIGVRGEDFEDICGDSIKETFKSKVNESFEALLSVAKGNAEDENMSSEIDCVDSVSEVVRKRMCSDEPEIKKKKIDDIKTDMDEIQGKKYHMVNWLSTMDMGSSSWCQQSPEEKRSWRKEKRHE